MGKKLYRRERYLEKIRPFYNDDDIIKVITGVRRCGKSCLVATVAEELVESGVPEKDIAFIDLDSRKHRSVATPSQLESAIDALVDDGGEKYLFIDEVQNVKGFLRRSSTPTATTAVSRSSSRGRTRTFCQVSWRRSSRGAMSRPRCSRSGSRSTWA